MKNRYLKSVVLTALLVALLATGLNALAEAAGDGASPSEVAAQVQEMARRLEEARALDIELNRSDLQNLKLVDGPIYVTGLSSPDTGHGVQRHTLQGCSAPWAMTPGPASWVPSTTRRSSYWSRREWRRLRR